MGRREGVSEQIPAILTVWLSVSIMMYGSGSRYDWFMRTLHRTTQFEYIDVVSSGGQLSIHNMSVHKALVAFGSVIPLGSGSTGQWGVRSFWADGRTYSITTKGSSLGTEPQYARDCVAFGICYNKAAQVRRRTRGGA